MSGKVTDLNPPEKIGQGQSAIVHGPLGYKAVRLITDDGLPVILYVAPRTAG